MIYVGEFIFSIKKVLLSVYAHYRKLWLNNIFRPSMLLFASIKVKAISKYGMKKYAEMDPLINVLIHFIKSYPKPYRFRTDIKKN